MKALVYTGPSCVEVLDISQPQVQEGEALVEVSAAGICGSDLHGVQKPGFRVPPLVMGHEFAGTTSDGRRVAINPIISCGQCDLCARGRTQLCRDRTIVGVHRPGGFAELVAVPESQLHTLPRGMSWEQAAMVEPIANAVHAWAFSDTGPGARVGVIGAGTIGLVCLLRALSSGAGEVVVADLSESRLALANELGATQTAFTLEGEFDLTFDAVGLAATRRTSVEHVAPGGTAVWLGLMEGEPGFDSLDLVRQEKRVVGSFAYTDSEFAEALEFAATGDFGWIYSFPLAKGAQIFKELMNGRTDIIKAVLRP